jgi:hypothetical protein
VNIFMSPSMPQLAGARTRVLAGLPPSAGIVPSKTGPHTEERQPTQRKARGTSFRFSPWMDAPIAGSTSMWTAGRKKG